MYTDMAVTITIVIVPSDVKLKQTHFKWRKIKSGSVYPAIGSTTWLTRSVVVEPVLFPAVGVGVAL